MNTQYYNKMEYIVNKRKYKLEFSFFKIIILIRYIKFCKIKYEIKNKYRNWKRDIFKERL